MRIPQHLPAHSNGCNRAPRFQTIDFRALVGALDVHKVQGTVNESVGRRQRP